MKKDKLSLKIFFLILLLSIIASVYLTYKRSFVNKNFIIEEETEYEELGELELSLEDAIYEPAAESDYIN